MSLDRVNGPTPVSPELQDIQPKEPGFVARHKKGTVATIGSAIGLGVSGYIFRDQLDPASLEVWRDAKDILSQAPTWFALGGLAAFGTTDFFVHRHAVKQTQINAEQAGTVSVQSARDAAARRAREAGFIPDIEMPKKNFFKKLVAATAISLSLAPVAGSAAASAYLIGDALFPRVTKQTEIPTRFTMLEDGSGQVDNDKAAKNYTIGLESKLFGDSDTVKHLTVDIERVGLGNNYPVTQVTTIGSENDTFGGTQDIQSTVSSEVASLASDGGGDLLVLSYNAPISKNPADFINTTDGKVNLTVAPLSGSISKDVKANWIASGAKVLPYSDLKDPQGMIDAIYKANHNKGLDNDQHTNDNLKKDIFWGSALAMFTFGGLIRSGRRYESYAINKAVKKKGGE